MSFYGEEYYDALAKKKGFGSYKEYARYLLKKRKEKLEEIGKMMETELYKIWRK